MKHANVGTIPTGADVMSTEPGAFNGGMASGKGPLKSLVITIGVRSIDDALKTSRENGGRNVGGKQSVGQVGFTACFRDSEGKVVDLRRASEE